MRNKLRGSKEIFRFTLIQSLKAKSMKIATLILCVIALISVPVISMINGEGKEGPDETSIKRVKVVDMTGLNLEDNMEVLKSEGLYKENEKMLYTDIQYEKADIDFEKVTADAETKDIYKFDEKADYVYMQITYGALNGSGQEKNGKFDVQIIYSTDTLIKKSDVTDYNAFVGENFRRILINNLELTQEQKQIVESVQVTKYQKDIDAAEDKKNSDKEDEQTAKRKNNIIYTTLMIVMFALAFGGERIAMSIITEKASKVMEYLMTSVRPMAIVVGKILANIVILFIQASLIVLSFIASMIINGMINSNGDKLISLPSFMTEIFTKVNFPGLNPVNAVLAVLIFIGGFIFYGMVAGLAGASVSKMDEIAEGVKIYTILLIIGAYISIFVVTSSMYDGTSAFKYFTMLFPITSIFITPATILTGYVSTTMALLSFVIMTVSVVFLTKFVSDVYESMVYYNGSALKLKDIINISKQNKKDKNNRKKEEE